MKSTDDRNRRLAIVIPVLLIVLPLVYSVGAWAVSATGPDEPFLEMPDERFTECVRDTEYMRFSHMTLLMDARDGIRSGERGDIGLSNLKPDLATPISSGDDSRTDCSDCHTSRENFCYQCHSSVNLNLDCFTCHEYQ